MSIETIKNRLKGNGAGGGVIIRETRAVKLTLQELGEVIEANPNHPRVQDLAGLYNKLKLTLPPDHVVYPTRAILEAILEDLEVEDIAEVGEDGAVRKRTRTGAKRKGSSAA